MEEWKERRDVGRRKEARKVEKVKRVGLNRFQRNVYPKLGRRASEVNIGGW